VRFPLLHINSYHISDPILESSECLLGRRPSRNHTQHVEPHRLTQRPALSDGHSVPLVAPERRRDVRGDVGVPLLISLVLLDVVQVVPPQHDGPVHLGRHNLARQNTATDGHISSERALLVDELALNRLLRGLEAEADVLVPAVASLAGDLGRLAGRLLVAAGDSNLTLEGPLVLLLVDDSTKFGRIVSGVQRGGRRSLGCARRLSADRRERRTRRTRGT